MTIFMRTHGGKPVMVPESLAANTAKSAAAISTDARADFGYLFPPTTDSEHYHGAGDIPLLDQLADVMVPPPNPGQTTLPVTPDSNIAPVFTYWGQFLDHELTANTDRNSAITNIFAPVTVAKSDFVERDLKNARTPRFDLDSVYGGALFGMGSTPASRLLVNALRDPQNPARMRVGENRLVGGFPDPANRDRHRDLPRFGQLQPDVRQAAIDLIGGSFTTQEQETLNKRALIGDMRNDENLLIAQFHLTFLRFHNSVVDFVAANPDTGLFADYATAKALTRLHYQDLVLRQYLPTICDANIVQQVIDSRAEPYFAFQRAHAARVRAIDPKAKLMGNAIPIEFALAAFRFGHSMVRGAYDHNRNFENAPFAELFRFTGGGELAGLPTLPTNWIIDWNRFTAVQDATSPGKPHRRARRIDTLIAPPLKVMRNEKLTPGDITGDVATNARREALIKHLAQRNLRRGVSLRLPTGQALHAFLRTQGWVSTTPQSDISQWVSANLALHAFLQKDGALLARKTPLWLYILAEAEHAGGDCLGEVGSWIVASTFIAAMLADPNSAPATGFSSTQSPLRTPTGAPIDSIDAWIDFAGVRV